jgi:GTP cyclohydrolase I/GTP cyclohydrolase-4
MDATVECVVDLDPDQKGVHMSRFEEEVNEAIDAVLIGEAIAIEVLAEHIAQRVVERQGAVRGMATIRVRYGVRDSESSRNQRLKRVVDFTVLVLQMP